MEKADLRRTTLSYLETIADTVDFKSRLICNHLLTIDAIQRSRQSERLMSFVSMPLEVDTMPLFAGGSLIVPCCEANDIVPIRIFSLDELEPSGSLKLLEPKLSVRQNDARRVAPEQIEIVFVPGLAFDRLGNRLGRGKGFYDRFLRRLPADTLTIGLAFDGMIYDHIPHNTNDYPVKMIVTENEILTLCCHPEPPSTCRKMPSDELSPSANAPHSKGS